MKFLILNDRFPPEAKGGADIMSWRFAQKLVQNGHQVFVFTTTDEKDREGVADENDLKIYRLFCRFSARWMAYAGLYNHRAVKRLKEIIRKEKPALLWAHNVHCALSYACLRKAKKMGVPIVLSVHDAMPFCYRAFDCWIGPQDQKVDKDYSDRYKHSPWQCWRCQRFRYFPLRNLFIRYFLRFVDKIVAVTAEHQKLLLINKIRCGDYVYNGIESLDVLPSEQEIVNFKRKFNLEGKRVIFWGGRINKACGVFQTLSALKEVVKEIPQAVLLVAARIDLASESLLKRAEELDLKGKVMVTGWLEREDLNIIYQICDLAVCASIAFETFGLIPLEAMAGKKPAMATCFGGPREVISNGLTGYIFNPFNISDFSRKIIRILNNQNLAKRMGEAGYQKYKEKFTLDKVFNDYLNIFNQLLENKF